MNMFNPHKAFSKAFPKTLQEIAALLSQKLEEGHICIDLSVENNLNTETISNPQLLKLNKSSVIESPQPFVLHRNRVYFHRYFQYENLILDKIAALSKYGENCHADRKRKLKEMSDTLKSIFDLNSSGNNLQFVAAVTAYLNNFAIITGGPGTGKTTTVANLVALLYMENPEMKVAVAAPTGKASARLNDVFKAFKKESLEIDILQKINSLEAKTIHRLLGGYHRFKHNADNPLDLDLLIVDECSMIDAALMAKLLSAVPDHARLILLGDRNQLSSVEAGSIFADLCVAGLHKGNVFSENFQQFLNDLSIPFRLELNISTDSNPLPDCITELNTSHRFKEGEGISRFSRLTISGKSDDFDYSDYIKPVESGQTVKITDTSSLKIEENSEFKMLLKEIENYLKEADISKSFEKLNTFKILCATREGKFGMHSINRLIEQSLGIKSEKKEYYHKQPILITKNDSLLGIFNGDIGIVINKNEGMKSEDGKKSAEKLSAYFNIKGELKEIPLMYITDYETAFAMTIHKSQGSEYDKVFVFLPSNPDHPLLSRELLYTAVTRSKSQCFVYGTEDVIRSCISKQIKRVSGISERLGND